LVSAPALSLSPRASERERLAARVRLLSWASLMYIAFEGGIAILAGVVAGSVALVGFGLDSAIEGFASAIIVWRFTGHRVFSDAAERRAQKLVALQFFVLAPYVGFESVKALLESERPDISWLGIALSASSLVVMPYLGLAKQRLAEQLGSAATRGEGRQNMLLPGRRAAARALGQRDRGCLVAGSAGRHADRGARRQGRARGVAGRGVLRVVAAGTRDRPGARRLLRRLVQLGSEGASSRGFGLLAGDRRIAHINVG
jgi:hypothetical protein